MNCWLYYMLHTFVNSIKKLFRSTFVITIVAIIATFIIFSVAGGIISSVALKGEMDTEQIEENIEDTEYEDEGDTQTVREGEEDTEVVFEFGIGEDDSETIAGIELNKENGLKLLEAIIELVIVCFVAWGLFIGTKNGCDIFLMSDVNFLFTAPIKPQSVLMFRLVMQMIAGLLASLYIVFQIPNMAIGFNLKPLAIVIIIISWFLLLVISRIMSVLSYTIGSTYKKVKDYMIYIILLFLGTFFIPPVVIFMNNGRDLLDAINKCLAADWTRWIPIVGWYKGMFMSAIVDDISGTMIYMGLMTIGLAAMFYLIWNIKADFYEESLAGAQSRAEQLESIKQNKNMAKANKKKNAKLREKSIGEIKGRGAVCFLTKELYCRRRTAHFGIVSNMMILNFTAMVAVIMFTEKVMEIRVFEVAAITSLIIIYLMRLGNPIARETNRNWLFLVPEDSYKKVFFAMAAPTVNTFLDILPGAIVTGIITKANPLVVLLWLVTITSMGFFLDSIALMLEAFFPSESMELVKTTVQMIIKIFVFVALVVIVSVGIMLINTTFVAAVLIGCAVAGGVLVFLVYPAMLHNGLS